MENKEFKEPFGIEIPSFTSTTHGRKDYLSKNYPEFLKWLEEYYPFAKDLRERIYLFKHRMVEAPKCPVCGNYCHLTGSMKYTSHCSPRCGQDDPETKKKTGAAYKNKTDEEMSEVYYER